MGSGQWHTQCSITTTLKGNFSMNDEYILIDRREQPGKNGVTMWRLTFQSIQDNEIVEMTVDPTYRNFKTQGWDHVVRHDCPYGVYRGLRRTSRQTASGVTVVSADSLASITHRCESHEQALQLAQASLNHNSPAERLAALFE
jgi:hypothetical protein